MFSALGDEWSRDFWNKLTWSREQLLPTPPAACCATLCLSWCCHCSCPRFVTSGVDHYCLILTGLIGCLDWVLRSTARLLCHIPNKPQSSVYLHNILNWLPASQHISYRIAVLDRQSGHGVALVVLCSVCPVSFLPRPLLGSALHGKGSASGPVHLSRSVELSPGMGSHSSYPCWPAPICLFSANYSCLLSDYLWLGAPLCRLLEEELNKLLEWMKEWMEQSTKCFNLTV